VWPSSEIRPRHRLQRPSANAIPNFPGSTSDNHRPAVILPKGLITWWVPHSSSKNNPQTKTSRPSAK